MKPISTALIATLTALSAQAQTGNGSIQGSVTDPSRKAFASASVSLCRASDSSILKMAVAGADGRFRFEGLADGAYLLSVSAVGHANAWSAPVAVSPSNPSATVPAIELAGAGKTMAAVTVVARRPLVEQKADRTVVNVDASVSNIGASALEVLEKAPGVRVDKDGNISLKGKQGVQVYIDGRPAYLSGTELANYLKGLPASAIDQIELMTNPSAKYDAAGNAGIINIRSKKTKVRGFNGNLNIAATQAKYTSFNNSVNLNYRVGKWNLFGSVNQNHGNHWQALDISRRYRANDGTVTAVFEQESRMHGVNDNVGMKLGADYFVNKRTTLGLVLSGFSNPEDFSSRSTSYLQNAHSVTDSIAYATSDSRKQFRNGGVNVNFRTQLDTTGRELSADVDVARYHSANKQRFDNNNFDPTGGKRSSESLRGDLPVDIRILSARTDYTHPFHGGLKLEAGLKASYVSTTNGSYYYKLLPGAEWVDTGKTNQFNYREQISAGYVNINKELGNWGFQAGLRYEHTNYEGKQFGSPDKAMHADSSFTRSYGNLFPTAFVSYKAGKNNQFSLSYGRRIDRPAYQDLNPFLFFLDKYTYEQGNPFMRPQFTHNVELAHTFKGFLTTTLSWSQTEDLLMETFLSVKDPGGNETYATIVKNGNIGRRDYLGLSVSAQVPVSKWWTASLYGNIEHNRFSGRLNGNGEELHSGSAVAMVNANNQFRFGKGWGAELSGFYRTSGVEGQLQVDPMGQVSGGVSKQVLKGKGTVKFAMRDIFYTNTQTGSISVPNTELHFRQWRNSQAGTVSFVWRFGKAIKDGAPRRNTRAASEELNRVKGAN